MNSKGLIAGALFLSILPAGAFSAEGQVPKGPEAEDAAYYTVVEHDTLWAISGRFLKDPFKWPDIWSRNPDIKNPHLIYPGNMLKITPSGIDFVHAGEAGKSGANAEEPLKALPEVILEDDIKDDNGGLREAEAQVVVLEPEDKAAATGDRENVAGPTEAGRVTTEAKEKAGEEPAKKPASFTLLRKGFITDREIETGGVVMGTMDEAILIQAGDKVYVSLKDKALVKAGDEYAIYEAGKEIRHPIQGKRLGTAIEIVGTLKILSTGDVMEAIIGKAFKEIKKGARLKALKEPAFAEVQITKADALVEGVIVASTEDKMEISKGDAVYIDAGTRHGLKKGNQMNIYSELGGAKDPFSGKRQAQLVDAGVLVVVDTYEAISIGIISKSFRSINAGDAIKTAVAAE